MVKKVIVSGLVLFGLLGCESNENIKSMNKNLQMINQNIETIKQNSVNSNTKHSVEQTICFSQAYAPSSSFNYASLGEDISLNNGSCQGKTLLQMNQEGWRLIQVVTGLNNAFGMVFER
jgi:hypothetical protein